MFLAYKIGSHISCNCDLQIYLSLILAAVFIIPAIMILICYIIIIYVIWTKSKSGLTLPDPKKSSFARRIFGSTTSKGKKCCFKYCCTHSRFSLLFTVNDHKLVYGKLVPYRKLVSQN